MSNRAVDGLSDSRGRYGIGSWFLTVVVLFLLMAAYTWIQWRSFVPGVREPDSAAYVIMAERMARGAPLGVVDGDVFRYQEHVWVRNAQGEVMPKYAPGYPAVMALAWRWFGETAAYAVGPVAGGLALLAAFWLFLHWMSPLAAACATAVWGFSPMFIGYSGYVLTHGVDLAVVTGGMAALWCWMRRPGVGKGVIAGLLLGFAPVVRHANVLLALVVPVAIAIGWHRACLQRRGVPGVATLALLSAGLVFPFLLAKYNLDHFGSFWQTGYALSDEQSAYTWSRLVANLPLLLQSFNRDGLPMVFGLGLVGMVLIGPPGDALARWMWVLPLGLSYIAYYWAAPVLGMSFARFMLVTFPVPAGMAFALLDRLDLRSRWAFRFSLLGAALVLGVPQGVQALASARSLLSSDLARMVASAAGPVARHVPDGAVILSDPPCAWVTPGARDLRVYNLRAALGGNVRPRRSIGRWNVPEPRWQESRREWITDFYEAVGWDATSHFVDHIAVLMDQGALVLMLVPARSAARWRGRLGDGFRYSLLEEWSVPAAKPLWSLAGADVSRSPGDWALYLVERP